eukprot:gene310-940_t
MSGDLFEKYSQDSNNMDLKEVEMKVKFLQITDSNMPMSCSSDELVGTVEGLAELKPQNENFPIQDTDDDAELESANFTPPTATNLDTPREFSGAGQSSITDEYELARPSGATSKQPEQPRPTGRGRGRGRGKKDVVKVSNPPKPSGLTSTEPTISDLGQNHYSKLSMFLDPDSGPVIKNWSHLAREFSIPEAERVAMHRSYHGGGDPALVFMKELCKRKPTETVTGLMEKLKKLQRNDCSLFVSKWMQANPGVERFRDLPDDFLENLANKLTEKTSVIKCWKNLASLYNFTQPEIKSIFGEIKVPGVYSPTQVLLDYLKGKLPQLTLSEIIVKLRKIERNDVALELEKIAKTIKAP